MTVIPCQKNANFLALVDKYSKELSENAHEVGSHGLSEADFYQSGLFRAAIEKLRGQQAAFMGDKRDFLKLILNFLQDENQIDDWFSAESKNRHDYWIKLKNGRTAVVETKGCLDGNNVNIFSRPPNANEFYIWSLCSNPGSDPRKGVWSGIHTRLSAEIVSNGARVDGLIVWDMLCGTAARPCPKSVLLGPVVQVGPYSLPPPCIYVFPDTTPSPRNNPVAKAQPIDALEFLSVLVRAFRSPLADVFSVDFLVRNEGSEQVRTTEIRRDGAVLKRSKPTPIRRA